MMNKKTKNIVLIAVVLLVIVLVFFVYKNSKKTNSTVQEVSNITDNQTTTPPVESKNAQATNTQVVTVDHNSKEFNTAMASGRDAMLKNDYPSAINYYNQAISYNKNDSAPYIGLYTIYLNQKDWQKALDYVNKAIVISPMFGDYWNWKILVMDQGLNKSYAELKVVYDQGYPKIRTEEKVNLVTKFAMVAESHNQKDEAIKLWQKAIEINSSKKDIYQAEIDRLSK